MKKLKECPHSCGNTGNRSHRYTAGYVIRHQYVLLPGIVCSVFDRTLLPGLIQLGYRSLLPGIVCSGIYSLLPDLIQLGYLQSTSGLDTARVICILLSGLIQPEVCYFAERYDRCSVPVLVIDGWT
ncbi:hypothetical protein DPMN_013848 [Dreissena polymorpha]|uniref:Uncharacterized protein n=1 Tax=Dreissena polymorpha TaxID=45954 RepID=A0A9D4S415_DREPO|nr:hypothetical protein DPMN_013848 [Dreissena polymorpha]